MSDFITSFYASVVRPRAARQDRPPVGGSRVAPREIRVTTKGHNPGILATGMCRPINYTAILEGLPKPPQWMNNASCAQVGGDIWHPEQGGRVAPEAKRICASCPVREQCLEYALEMGDDYGVYAGTSAGERRKLRRARAKASAA